MRRSPCQKSPISLENGAIFIADAHYHPYLREELLEFLHKVEAPQLFFMGDIFDLLVGRVSHTIKANEEAIALLHSLSQKSECYYLEGNHDFLLQDIFPSMKVISRYEQPLIVKAKEKRVALAHGDIFIGGWYKRYIDLLHKSAIIATLDFCNFYGWISKKIQRYNASKNLCKKIENFKEKAQKRLSYYDANIVIEGHYHQRVDLKFGKKRYINLPAFGCSGEFLRYSDGEFSFARM